MAAENGLNGAAMESIVTLSGNLPVVSSTAIAEGVGREHKSVIQLVRQNLSDFEEFGGVAFEMRPFETAGGTQNREIALLNEQQATLLMTYMRNNEVVRAFKKRLVRAFYEMAKRVRENTCVNRQNPNGRNPHLPAWREDIARRCRGANNADRWKKAFWAGARREAGCVGDIPLSVTDSPQFASRILLMESYLTAHSATMVDIERLYLRRLRGGRVLPQEIRRALGAANARLERLLTDCQLPIFESSKRPRRLKH